MAITLFLLFAIGMSPAAAWVPWVTQFVEYWEKTDSRRVSTGASVGVAGAWQPASQSHVKAGARGLDWDRRPNSRSDFSERINSVKEPFVSHETASGAYFPTLRRSIDIPVS